jgi:hypothetical protein
MRAILEFNLDDFDDTVAHRRAIKALDMAHVLFELQYNFWKEFENIDGIEKIQGKYYDLIDEHDINIDKLIV